MYYLQFFLLWHKLGLRNKKERTLFMPIKADYHVHSYFSGDSTAPMEQMIQGAIQKGLTRLCFTEHMDFEFPYQPTDKPDMFIVNTDSYLYELLMLREKYNPQIEIHFGIELGLQTSIVRQNLIYSRSHEFDFIIGSSHVCNGKDPYYPAFYENRSEEEAYREYFIGILDNMKVFHNFDVYGHLDYVVRYGPNKDNNYTYSKYKDVIDPILSFLIENEKGLEVNTAGLTKGLKDVHPCTDILKRYRELGGEIITIGSDSHSPDTLGAHFDKAAEILTDCGFKYYCVFANRIAEYLRIH